MSPEIYLLLGFTYLTFFVVFCEHVTTIFQLKTTADGEWLTVPYFAHQVADNEVSQGYDNVGTWRVISRNSVRGLPLRKSDFGVLNVYAGQPCCDTWTHQGWSKLDVKEAGQQGPLLNTDSFVVNKTHNATASIWRLDRESAELRSPPIAAGLYQGNVCVSIVARVTRGTRLIVAAQHFLSDATRETESVVGSSRSSWVHKRIVIRLGRTVQNKMVQILLTGIQPQNTSSPILVQWAAGCHPDNREDVATSENIIIPPNITNELGFRPMSLFDNASLDSQRIQGVCHNDGIILPVKSVPPKCICRPGLTGKLCEKGCGPNRFGDSCASRCSSDSSSRQCRGMWFCTADLPCDCGPGFKGPLCDQTCEHGKYGVGCKGSCGKCAYGETCDRHTGWCANGCQGAHLPPFCKQECGRESVALPLIGYGTLAGSREHPWHAGIFDKDPRDGQNRNKTNYRYICGGTLISPKIVISVAYCFYDDQSKALYPAERFAVALGKKKSGWNADEAFPERVQKREIEKVHILPEYKGLPESTGDDIAVVVLATPVDQSDFVVPACFDRVGAYEQELEIGTVGKVVGWGRTENHTASEDLMETTVPYFSRVQCLDVAPKSFVRYVLAKDRFCAGEPGPFVGLGDSGGGFITLQGSAWYLRGVVSVAPPNERNFAAYTSVSYHRDWIVGIENNLDLWSAYFKARLS